MPFYLKGIGNIFINGKHQKLKSTKRKKKLFSFAINRHLSSVLLPTTAPFVSLINALLFSVLASLAS